MPRAIGFHWRIQVTKQVAIQLSSTRGNIRERCRIEIRAGDNHLQGGVKFINLARLLGTRERSDDARLGNPSVRSRRGLADLGGHQTQDIFAQESRLGLVELGACCGALGSCAGQEGDYENGQKHDGPEHQHKGHA